MVDLSKEGNDGGRRKRGMNEGMENRREETRETWLRNENCGVREDS